ncbi:MAG: helix-turn-helix domain-containing protein [Mycobacteriales bacterium]
MSTPGRLAIHAELEARGLVEALLSDPDALANLRDALMGSHRCHESPYMSVAEAAAFLRTKRQRIYDLLSAGTLTRYKDGGRTLVLREELAEYVAVTARLGDTPVTRASRSRSPSRFQR